MTKYMVVARYDESADWSEIGKLIPAEQARVAELRRDGTLEQLYLGQGRKAVFLVFNAGSEAALTEVLESLPLHRFWDTEVLPLEAPPIPQAT